MKQAWTEFQGTKAAPYGWNELTRTMMWTAVLVFLFTTASGVSLAQTPTTTTLVSSVNPSVYGQAVTFTATVSSSAGAPPDGETVTFLDGTKLLGTGSLSAGMATFTTSTLSVANHNVKATYPGDSNFGASSSLVVVQSVNKSATTTTLTSSPNPSNVTQTVTLTATVAPQYSGTPTGSVAFYNGGTKVGTAPLAGGVATFPTSKLPAGTDSLTAVYLGNSSFLKSTSAPVSQVVGAGTFIDSTMTWNGITRYYEVFVPTALPPSPAMLVMMHGTITQSAPNPQAIISLNWGWQNLANQNAFILVKPASTYNSKTGQWNWDAYYMDSAFQVVPDDSGFLRQLITTLTAQYNVNPKQVFVAGFSSGAQMAQRVGVEISDLVAAIVIGSGQIVGQLSPPPIVLPGAAVAPVSIQEWHGTLDTGLPPCNNGTTVYSGKTFYLATVDQSFNYWTGQNSCTVFQNSQPLCVGGSPNPATTGNDATGCTNNTEVQFIWMEGVAHSWQQQLDPQRWQFLTTHPKP